MNQKIVGTLFFITFLSIFFVIHYYLGVKSIKLFSIKKVKLVMFCVFLLAFSYPATSIFERLVPFFLSRWLVVLSSIWLGIMWLMLSLYLAHDGVSLIGRLAGFSLDPLKSGIVILSLIVIIGSYGVFNAQNLKVKTVEIPMNNLPLELDGYSIVHLTDIHAGAINGPAFVKRNVDLANSLNGDVVVITGDLFDGSAAREPKVLVKPLEELKSRYGAFFVTGNHEKYTGQDRIITAVESLDVKTLRSEVVDAGGVQIIGIDNPEKDMEKSNPNIGTIKFDKNKPAVLLYHIPLGMQDAEKSGVDLQLSGHTHGGQVFPFGLLEKFFYPVTRGLGEFGKLKLYVGVGSGTWGPPMRVGVPAEITKIILRSQS